MLKFVCVFRFAAEDTVKCMHVHTVSTIDVTKRWRYCTITIGTNPMR
jgi:hypothetical protein